MEPASRRPAPPSAIERSVANHTLTTAKTSRLLQQTLAIRDELNQILTTARDADFTIISADLGLITSRTVSELLVEIARKETSTLSLHIDGGRTENQQLIEILKILGTVTLKTGPQHGKRILIAYKNRNEPAWRHIVYEGSYNPNNVAHGRRINTEIALFTYNDADYYQQHLDSHEDGLHVPNPSRNTLARTPSNPRVYDTTAYGLNESLAARIHPEKGGTLYLGTMGYGQRELHAQLLNFCEHGTVHLIVDHESLTDESKKLLKKLTKAGAHVVVCKVNNNHLKGNFHRKYFVRLPDNTHADLVVLQSENLTNRTQQVFNHASYHPNNPELANEIIAGHKEAAALGGSFRDLFMQEEKPEELPKLKKNKYCCKGWYAFWAMLGHSNNESSLKDE